MDIQNLYTIAQEQNIEVLEFDLKETESMSIMLDSGACFIGIDGSVRDNGVQERVHLAHELGHCVTGSFYNRFATIDHRQRHENRADKWAIRNLIPVNDLDEAVAHGYTEIWELAEYFDVTDDFVRKAVCLYVHGNLATELCF